MKRVKRQVKKSANPLFEEWLLAWQKDAADKGSELQHCFGKALRSLRKYPLPLLSGKECVILENFGKKICEMLDKRLEEYKRLHTEEEWRAITSFSSEISISVPSDLSQSQEKDNSKSYHKLPKKLAEQPSNSEKTYVPGYRSGAYAILLALFHSYSDELVKSDIQVKAQEFCDVSFTKKTNGTFYNAWSSMTTLVNKGLVIRKSKPVRFTLTDAGKKLAEHLILNSNAIIASNEPLSLTAKSPRKEIATSSSGSNYRDCRLDLAISPLKSLATDNVGGIGEVNEVVFIDSEINTLGERKLPCANIHELEVGQSDEIIPIDTQKRDTFGLLYQSPPKKVRMTCVEEQNEIILIDPPEVASNLKIKNTQTNKSPLKGAFMNPKSKTKTALASLANLDKQLSDSEPSSSENSCLNNICLAPGHFTILLLVDIHETDLRKKEKIDLTVQTLQRLGVKCEPRHLTVGDFIWICRDNNNKKSELVLPYVVERKRMDDLAGSIKDGRFHEQKFRLKQSGICHKIYLVEKLGKDNARFGLPLPTLHQATTNTQIVDGFIVKISRSHDDSLKFLAMFTQHLVNLFRMKTLLSCGKQDLPEFHVDADLLYLMHFAEFNKASSKIKKFTVKDMLIKQLLQLKGLSVDKATAIANRYETPSALIDALASGGEELLADISYAPLRRLGPATSTTLHQLYSRHGVLCGPYVLRKK